jgi:enoyl-[acyl-carrier protein] reductase III
VTARPSLQLTGRTALVTGGSRGIGLAIARKLGGCGAQVLINYARSDADADAAVRSFDDLPGRAAAVRGDVADPAQLGDVLTAAQDRFGGLDIFVHNASHLSRGGLLGTDPATVQRSLAVALHPLLYGAPRLAELMTGGAGRIVVVSSLGSRRVVPGYAAGGVAKAALESLVRYLSAELAGRAIAVNAVSTAKVDKGDGQIPAEALKPLVARTPAGRLTTPEDVADVVALLCADEARWIHGQVITADGGLGLTA